MTMTDREQKIKFGPAHEHIRLRPGMYIGGTDSRALHNLLFAGIDEAVNEIFCKRATRVEVALQPENKLRIVCDSSGPFRFEAMGRTIYVPDLPLVAALSESFTFELMKEGYLWEQHISQGVVQVDLFRVRPLQADEADRMVVTFTPDFTILEPNAFDFDTIAVRLQEIATTLPGATAVLVDERGQVSVRVEYRYPNGVRDLVEYLNRDAAVLHKPVSDSRTIQVFQRNSTELLAVEVAFAFQYIHTDQTIERGYANTELTKGGGVHLVALRSSLVNAINAFAYEADWDEFEAEWDNLKFLPQDVLSGLTTIVSVKHPHLRFESNMRDKLENPEVYGAVSAVVYEAVWGALEANGDLRHTILNKCLQNRARRLGNIPV
jgi:DNA gyrase subunit B